MQIISNLSRSLRRYIPAFFQCDLYAGKTNSAVDDSCHLETEENILASFNKLFPLAILHSNYSISKKGLKYAMKKTKNMIFVRDS